MQHRVCLLFTLPYLLSCLPGEKFRINPDDVERVVQISNMTRRDPTAKNVNFAWKMTVRSTVSTTMDPARTSTLNAELNKKNNEIYDKLFAQLAYTLRDKIYLNRWLNEMDKGYHIFLYEIQKQDKKYYFLRRVENEPPAFSGEDGSFLFSCMVDFLRGLANKEEFLVFMDSLQDRIERDYKTTLSWAQRNVSLNDAYNNMFMQLSHTLVDSDYREKWMTSNRKGFPIFLQDLKDLGPGYFIKPVQGDDSFVGEKGKHFWYNIITFFQFGKQEGFEALLSKVDSLPPQFNVKDLQQINLPDVGEIIRNADETGTLTPINWDLHTIPKNSMIHVSTKNLKTEKTETSTPINWDLYTININSMVNESTKQSPYTPW